MNRMCEDQERKITMKESRKKYLEARTRNNVSRREEYTSSPERKKVSIRLGA